MKKYKIILFDLDGTLTDPGEGITNSVAYALNKFNIEVKNKKELYKFIGPPLYESFMKYYGFSEEKANKAVEYYREYFSDKGIFENEVYEGIEGLLELLNKNGKCICLATSKPEIYAKRILEHFNLTQYFHFIAGSELDGTRIRKDEVISYALSHCEFSDRSEIIMIGDREHDILGAKKNSLDSMGVLFGYGSRSELKAAGATHIVNEVSEIGNLVI